MKHWGVSESTVKRRVREHGISVRDGKCNMTDVGLDEVLRQVKTEFPKAGFHSPLPASLKEHQSFAPKSAGSNE